MTATRSPGLIPRQGTGMPERHSAHGTGQEMPENAPENLKFVHNNAMERSMTPSPSVSATSAAEQRV